MAQRVWHPLNKPFSNRHGLARQRLFRFAQLALEGEQTIQSNPINYLAHRNAFCDSFVLLNRNFSTNHICGYLKNRREKTDSHIGSGNERVPDK